MLHVYMHAYIFWNSLVKKLSRFFYFMVKKLSPKKYSRWIRIQVVFICCFSYAFFFISHPVHKMLPNFAQSQTSSEFCLPLEFLCYQSRWYHLSHLKFKTLKIQNKTIVHATTLKAWCPLFLTTVKLLWNCSFN